MKLLVATIILFLKIHDGEGASNSIFINIIQKVSRTGCCDTPDTSSKEPDVEPTTTEVPTTTTIEPTTTEVPTTTTIEPTTTTYCDSLRTTICPDGSRCHDNATCIPNPPGYYCKCNIGYAGDGADCGLDDDIDEWSDVNLTCCIVNTKCVIDNCIGIPNSGQEDWDNDGKGDACDDDEPPPPTVGTTPAPSNFCIPIVPHTECNLICNDWKTKDTDGDGHVDYCDNCPYDYNYDQTVIVCDTETDTDGDCVPDGIDNCINDYNPDQSDVDYDGLGDACDYDADCDGIINTDDNCWLVPNPGQEDGNSDGVGDVCHNDQDGDCQPDNEDICPKDSKINHVDFTLFKKKSLDKSKDGEPQPDFEVTDKGKEIIQYKNSKPGLMYGEHTNVQGGVDFDGTFFIDSKGKDNDYAGFIFGYKHEKSFYVVMWKKSSQNFWACTNSTAKRGLQLKKVHSNLKASNACLADALWNTQSTPGQVTVLWHDSDNMIGWDHDTSYRWELIHRPHIGLIRFRFVTKAGVIADSGNIYDDQDECNQGGKLGVYCHSQAWVKWSNLKYKCDDDSVPKEVYDDLPSDLQAKVHIDHSKLWTGKVKTQRVKPKLDLVTYEPGIGLMATRPTRKEL